MKKLLYLLMFSLLVVAGCSSEETSEEQESDIEEHSDIEQQDDDTISDDPLEVGNKNNDINKIEYNYETYKVVDWYSNSDTNDDGFNTVDFNGYTFDFSFAVVEDEEGEQYIGMFGETENKTNDVVQFNADMEFLTDTQDQTELEDGIGKSKPKVKLKGFSVAPLEYGVPESFKVTIDPPFKEKGEDEYMEGDFGEPIELEFTKE